jgi:hypothetical protein
MLIRMIEGVTRVIGKSQGYLGLPLRDEVIACPVGGPDTPAMVSAWEPTPKELAQLQAGAAVHLRVLGTAHPPVLVFVGPAPDAQPVPGTEQAAAYRFEQMAEVLVGAPVSEAMWAIACLLGRASAQGEGLDLAELLDRLHPIAQAERDATIARWRAEDRPH